MITGIDHVAVTMPAGAEDIARDFFGQLLGLPEMKKPATLEHKGGVWFVMPDGRHLHLQAESDHVGAPRAHPALAANDLDEFARKIEGRGLPVDWDTALAPRRRFYTADPFGNRLELIEAL